MRKTTSRIVALAARSCRRSRKRPQAQPADPRKARPPATRRAGARDPRYAGGAGAGAYAARSISCAIFARWYGPSPK